MKTDNSQNDEGAIYQSHLNEITQLYLASTNLNDISVLSNLPNLKELDLKSTNIPQAQIDALKEANPNITINQ